MVKKELIAIGLSFLLVLGLAGIFAISAFAITGYMDMPSEIVEPKVVASTIDVIMAS